MEEKLQKLLDKAEYLGWRYKVHEDGSIGLENWSPAGEDIILELPGEDIIREMREYAANFDVDEHVESLVEMRGKRGVPSSVRVLVEDAEEIQEMLDLLSEAFDRVSSTPIKSIYQRMVCPDCKEEVLAKIVVVGKTPMSKCPKCGTIHEEHRWYKFAGEEKMKSIIETKEPRGLFLCDTGVEVIGIDNSTGEAITEEFPDKIECVLWLIQEREDD